MKTNTQPASQRTFDDLLGGNPRPVRREVQLSSEPFVSPIANIPTNRTPLSPTSKPR